MGRRLTTPACRAASVRLGAAALAAPLLTGWLVAPAAAAVDGVEVTNTETVQALLDASGQVREARVYEQLSFEGAGRVDVVNPVSTEGIRNLDAFGGFDLRDGSMVTTVDVHGSDRLRTVSDFTGDLPLSVEVVYLLDGQVVPAKDVVGASGTLEARYRVSERDRGASSRSRTRTAPARRSRRPRRSWCRWSARPR